MVASVQTSVGTVSVQVRILNPVVVIEEEVGNQDFKGRTNRVPVVMGTEVVVSKAMEIVPRGFQKKVVGSTGANKGTTVEDWTFFIFVSV